MLSPGQVYWTVAGALTRAGVLDWLVLSPGQVYWTVAGALTRAGVLDWLQTWDWEKVKKEENDAGVWGPQ